MNQQDILFASLVGSKVAEKIPRFDIVQNELAKHVLPPIPFLPINTDELWQQGKPQRKQFLPINTDELWQQGKPQRKQFFPFVFFDENDKAWPLPYEPIINISGKNNIIRRNVAKSNQELVGTIKERWSQDDYQITITGALIGSILTGDMSECFPRKDFEKLKKMMCRPDRIKVNCEPLQILGISYIVIEDFSFPFTKGENVQAYEIKAYSDFDYNLLLEVGA